MHVDSSVCLRWCKAHVHRQTHTYAAKKHTRWHTQAHHATRHALPNEKKEHEQMNFTVLSCMIQTLCVYVSKHHDLFAVERQSVTTAYDAPSFHLARRLEQTSQQQPQVHFGGETNASISSHICGSQRKEHVWLRFVALDRNMDLLCISNISNLTHLPPVSLPGICPSFYSPFLCNRWPFRVQMRWIFPGFSVLSDSLLPLSVHGVQPHTQIHRHWTWNGGKLAYNCT